MVTHPDAPQNKAMGRVFAALKHARVRTLIVDDADSLKREGLAELQMLVEKSTCTILLIGLSGFPAGFDAPLWGADRVVDPIGAQSNEEEA